MYQTIMVPLDGSELAESVIPHLELVASRCSPREIVLVSAVETSELWPAIHEPTTTSTYQRIIEMQRQEHEYNLEQGRKYLKGIAERILSGTTHIRTEVLSGPVEQSLIGFAESHSVDLIVLATHGRSGPSRWIWGSVADKLLRGTCVPVLMIRAPGCPTGR